MVSTWMTPACSSIIWAMRSSRLAAAVRAARTGLIAPLPDLTATIGLDRDTLRAMRENLRGLPKLSRYSSTTSVAASESQYCSRSLPETSARLPAETKVDNPIWRCAAVSRIAMPSAPD
ncbi:Uncharacterised protein [Mycobacteroides abscessus subsp. abscessus]|nr:Uncharacterised protein [Mycobacteroides abscessus subsp. abscessus]